MLVTILSHVLSGTIYEIGSEVKDLKLGDSVCVHPNDICGEFFYYCT